MKRKGNIYEKITDLNNIETAIYRASKGKGNRKSVEKYSTLLHIMLCKYNKL